ncbi:MAG: DUF2069 domain-containing protein [Methylobacter tundripaludum]|jgi:uncharacterized membrane protein|uniref:Putative membrane protein n=1 Tax=Methylobacter tundripaludum TaxID=173365 RepID=A0A2S6HHW4_9GAMM|nr:DUF2069 domain-containing protein [Methylobacter tundripaludum]MDD4905983.1 DUF2069 domain-containing protein [Methylobacter tundripaludum]PPK77072.1 putative membrane protein [Methylobacter tundripaludum]
MIIKPIYCYITALAGFFGLFALLMLWNTILSPSTRFPVALVLLVAVTPLLLPMRGLLDRNPRSCAWAAYVSLIYFLHGTAEAYVNPDERLYASLEVMLSLMLFFGTAFYVRLVGKQN